MFKSRVMIKKTLYFGNPSYLHLKDSQLMVKDPESDSPDQSIKAKIPIEDIGLVVLDHQRISITQTLMLRLLENNAAVILCNDSHLPVSLTLPIAYNDTFSEKVRIQLQASEPLKKQLWRQTIMAKINNQAGVLKALGLESTTIGKLASRVKSGDPDNLEGQAASIYWETLLDKYNVTRGRFDGPPNQFFNYGYAILRAIIARNLVGSGCLTVLGIHHKNKYNPYCLADDIMEPYRPLVDLMIFKYLSRSASLEETLSKEDKAHLLQIPVMDVKIDGKSSPLMVGSQRTSASLIRCFEGTERKILYPTL